MSEMTIEVRGCRYCEPRLSPTSDRQGENHVAVRFGDVRPDQRVLHDGVQVDGCVEVMAGEGGWAILELTKDADFDRFGVERHPSGIWSCICSSGALPRVLVRSDGFAVEQ